MGTKENERKTGTEKTRGQFKQTRGQFMFWPSLKKKPGVSSEKPKNPVSVHVLAFLGRPGGGVRAGGRAGREASLQRPADRLDLGLGGGVRLGGGARIRLCFWFSPPPRTRCEVVAPCHDIATSLVEAPTQNQEQSLPPGNLSLTPGNLCDSEGKDRRPSNVRNRQLRTG